MGVKRTLAAEHKHKRVEVRQRLFDGCNEAKNFLSRILFFLLSYLLCSFFFLFSSFHSLLPFFIYSDLFFIKKIISSFCSTKVILFLFSFTLYKNNNNSYSFSAIKMIFVCFSFTSVKITSFLFSFPSMKNIFFLFSFSFIKMIFVRFFFHFYNKYFLCCFSSINYFLSL
ncbi:unnamed protein product [Acanthosepion pharaonis]|uniref:Uncharacterized protein n=1 Tax=Acanthosepion pharaonis TaxID=158019 RepID=A0A812D6K7_ACAPH|nr:unnamed protein product [Sepia pharaonis]